MAFPVVEQAIESSTNTAGTSHVVDLPTATANQLLLIILDKGSTAATVNAHASLTELLDENSGNGLYIAYRWMDGTEPSTYTLTTSANTRSARIAYRLSGVVNPAAVAPQIGTTGTGTSATPDPPASAAPPSTKDYLFIAFAGMAGEEADDDTWGNTPPTNYTPSPPRQKSCGTAGTNLGGLIVAAERQLNTGSAQDPGTFGVDTSAAWRSQTITVHPPLNTTVTPSTASLTLSPFAPTVTATQNKLVTPGVATLTLTTFAPTVLAPRTVTPGVVSLTIGTFAPTVTASDHKSVTPATANLALTTFAPTVTATESDNIVVTPDIAALNLATFAPTVTTTDHQTVTPTTAELVLATFAPVVTYTSNVTVTPGVAALVLASFAPTVTAYGDSPGGGYSGVSPKRVRIRRAVRTGPDPEVLDEEELFEMGAL
jgi:ribosomal protein S19